MYFAKPAGTVSAAGLPVQGKVILWCSQTSRRSSPLRKQPVDGVGAPI